MKEYDFINDQIGEIISAKKMTQKKFAAEMETLPGTLNNILNKRNKPSLKILVRMFERFEDINANWFFRSEGEMFIPPEDETKNQVNGISESEAKLLREEIKRLKRVIHLHAPNQADTLNIKAEDYM